MYRPASSQHHPTILAIPPLIIINIAVITSYSKAHLTTSFSALANFTDIVVHLWSGQTDITTAFGVEAQALSNLAQVVLTIAAKRTKLFVFFLTCWCRTVQILPKELKCPAVLESTLSRSLLSITAFSDTQAQA